MVNKALVNSRSITMLVIAALVVVLLAWTVLKRLHLGTAGIEGEAGSAPQAQRQEPLDPVAASPSLLPSNAQARRLPLLARSLGGLPSLLDRNPDPAKARSERDRLIAELERQHRAEPMDPVWAGQAEPALGKLASSPDIAVSGIEPKSFVADCRSATCKLSGTFDSSSDAEQWGMLLATGTGKTFRQTRTVVLPTSDGKYELRVYGVRR